MNNIHQRVLKLRDIALGLKKSVQVNSVFASVSYDSAVDSLLALYNECKGASSLSKDKNVLKFIRKYERTVLALEKLRVSAEDFEIKNTIGRGHFGEVVLCSERSTGDIFAMKIMKKAHILQQPDGAFYSAERDIMTWNRSPWLTSLHYAFQDHTSLYLVMDYHPGGDLLTIMESNNRSMREDEARFYLAEIAAGLHDLHCLGFVHRDVKPENVLIARSGHIKLVDFGSAARLNDKGKVIDSQLPVGTPEYISPEVLTSLDKTADYGVCCDWWSLGIIAYELLYNTTPFEGETTSKTYNNVMNYKKSLSFSDQPKTGSEEEARALIKALLTDFRTRLGYAEIQNHTFFSLTDWDHLLDALPPHIPTVSGPDDVSNFDTFEPCKESDLKYPDIPTKTSGFSGKHLPFIGFTFNGAMTFDDLTASISPENKELEGDGSGYQKLKRSLERELEEERKKRLLLDRECVVYQSQLEDFHRKLELEKADRRMSDSRALQLLQEVREKGKMAQQLREEQTRNTETEYSIAVEQLEQERQEASKRLQRLQVKLKDVEKERDKAIKKALQCTAKLTEVKEKGRKEITGLQTRLSKVTKESSSKVKELQESLLEARERCAEALNKIKMAEMAKRKTEIQLHSLQASIDKSNVTTSDMSRQLEETKSIHEELQGKLESHQRTNEYLQKQSVSLAQQIKELEGQLNESYSQNQSLETAKLSLQHQLHEFGLKLKEVEQERERLKKNSEKTVKELKERTHELQKKNEAMFKLEANCSSLESRLKELNALKDNRISVDEKLKDSVRRVDSLEKKNKGLRENLSAISIELDKKSKETLNLTNIIEETRQRNDEVVSGLRTEVHSLQSKLNETSTIALQQGDRLREVRKARRELDLQNTDLTAKLRIAQRESERLEKQLKESSAELNNLRAMSDNLKQTELKLQALQSDHLTLENEASSAQQKIKEVTASRDQAKAKLSHAEKQLEAEELRVSMLQHNIKSLEEELSSHKTATQEAHKQQAHWKFIKETVESDLEMAENKIKELTTAIEKEKTSRKKSEQELRRVVEDTEKLVFEHTEELHKVSEYLVAEKERAEEYSTRILELEKELKLTGLSLKESQRALNTEKAVSSKFYDELQSRGRELGKLKAAHMKLLSESKIQNSELAQQEQILNQQRLASEEHQLQETRLQATIAQQNKLIDYLQGVGSSPESKGLRKIRKGLKLGRKGKDPAKEIAEWNRLKNMAGKGSSSGVIKSVSGTSISSNSTHEPVSPTITTPSGSNLVPPTTTASPLSRTHPQRPTRSSDMRSDERAATRQEIVSTPMPHPVPPSKTTTVGNKRKINEVSSAMSGSEQVTAQHNIPHKFRGIRKPGLGSNYTCAACKAPIKTLQKLIKCTYCHVSCHAKCIDVIPNNCGLPQALSSFTELEAPSSKRLKQDLQVTTLSNNPSLTSQASSFKKRDSTKPKSVSGKTETEGLQVTTLPNSSFLTSQASSSKKRDSTKPKSVSGKTETVASKTETAVKDTEKSKKKKKMMELEHATKITAPCPDSIDGDGSLKDEMKAIVTLQLVSETTKSHSETTENSLMGSDDVREELTEKPGPLQLVDSDKAKALGSFKKELENSPIKKDDEKRQMNLYMGFDSSKVIKMEQACYPRGGMMTEGWLVLTWHTLCLYDRDPRGVTRKPIHRFVLSEPGVAYVVVPSISKKLLPHSSPNNVIKAFGFQVHCASYSEQFCFVATSLQSKIDWVEIIQRVLSELEQISSAKLDTEHDHTSTGKHSLDAGTKGNSRALKEVTIVPITLTTKSNTSTSDGSPAHKQIKLTPPATEGSGLDLSIRSSMLNSSPDSSFI